MEDSQTSQIANRPPTIFKYENFAVQTLLNLKSQVVYFGAPKNFNDPYDCAITATIAEPSPADIAFAKNYYLNSSKTPDVVKKELCNLDSVRLQEQLMKIATHAVEDTKRNFLSNAGVTCFSEKNDDLLMWSHYGGRYKGICLEFRTEYEPFNKLRKVKYVENMPQLDVRKVVVELDSNQLIDLLCTKSKIWEYEKEWRAIHREAGTAFGYESKALKAVYFGPDIEREALEIVCLTLAGQNPDVELWEGSRSSTAFKVEFRSFTYTSHIDAKKLGLL